MPFEAEEEGLEPPNLTAAVFKTADLPLAYSSEKLLKNKKEYDIRQVVF